MHVEKIVRRAASLQLETERLVVRQFQAADRPVAMAHELDRRIMRFIRDPLTASDLEDKIDAFFTDWDGAVGRWKGFVVAPRDDPAGMIGVVAFKIEAVERDTVEFGYRLHPDHHGKGYATEASAALLGWLFDDCQVHKVTALCVADNERSYKVMERLGMQREARLREYSRLDGNWHDELVYGLLEREWQAGRRPDPTLQA